MSDATSAEMFKRGKEFLEKHRKDYLSSGGRQGHILDMSAQNGCRFATHLLLRTVGRKTGKTYIFPLSYNIIGSEVAIVASKGGADKHPAWYLNLTGSDEVSFQIGTQAFRATWREPTSPEREVVWNFLVYNHPSYAKYQATTARQIPVILLRAVEEITVFTEDDAT